MSLDFMRQKDIFNPEDKEAKIMIVGCGNIGSNVAVNLVRMGMKDFFLIDGDKVDKVNLTTQHFLIGDLEAPKVVRTHHHMNNVREVNVVTEATHLEEDQILSYKPDIVISGVDSLPARRAIKNCLIHNDIEVPVIDGRMGRQQVEVHTQMVSDWEIPEDGQEGMVEDVCTDKFIIYTPLMISALICETVKRIVSEQEYLAFQLYDFQNNSYLQKK